MIKKIEENLAESFFEAGTGLVRELLRNISRFL